MIDCYVSVYTKMFSYEMYKYLNNSKINKNSIKVKLYQSFFLKKRC